LRRALAAIAGTAAGTALLVGLKAGPPGQLAASPAAAGAPAVPTPGPGGTAAGGPGGTAPPRSSTPAAPVPGASVPGSPATATPTGAANGTGSAGPRPQPTSAPTTAPAGGLRPGTFTGTVAPTDYGPVQVRIVVTGGRMADVTAVQLPTDEARSRQISGRAAPILRQEALNAQNANIDTVSGASYTSQGYRASLQAALDAARR
jgi:uncharacterized protein with FMN-binding domain